MTASRAIQSPDANPLAESLWSAIMHARSYGQHAVADSLAVALALDMYQRGSPL